MTTGTYAMISGTWSFNSQDLNVDGKYMTDVLDGYDLPPVRGENILIPFKTGKLHTQKYFDERIITFGMAILGTDFVDLQTNIDAMLGVLGTRVQSLLSHTMPNGSVRQTYAEVVDSIKLKYQNDQCALATIEFLLSDPIFRDTSLYSVEATIDSTSGTNHDLDVTNPGNTDDRSSIITFTGPLAAPKITNITTGAILQYTGTLAAASDIVVVDCANWTAVDSGVSMLSYIFHSGDPAFMMWRKGLNHCHVLDGVGTTGKVKVEFYPPYL
jgi:hypothetical protein